MASQDAPPVLMVQGAGESLISWPDELCERLAAGGRHVITFDTRDTGESTSFPVGAPPYGLRDLVADTAGLIAALGLPAVHLVGLSQGAAVCQLLALEHPENVLSLTLTCSTPGGPGHAYDDLPPMSADLAAFFSGALAEPDWTDRAAVIDYMVAVYRPFASPARTFDEAGMREFAGRVFDPRSPPRSQTPGWSSWNRPAMRSFRRTPGISSSRRFSVTPARTPG